MQKQDYKLGGGKLSEKRTKKKRQDEGTGGGESNVV